MKNSNRPLFNGSVLMLCTLFLSATFLVGCSKSGSKSDLNPRNPYGQGPAPVSLSSDGGSLAAGDLGSAGNYVILSKTGISNVTGSSVTGNIAVSPAAATYITGFSLVADATNVFATSSSVVGGGKVYAANYANPTPSNLTTAVGSMETAYTAAAGRTPPDFLELGSGNIGGLTLAPGLYTWAGTVTIPLDITISGSATDVWIFQLGGNLTMAAAKSIILAGQAQAKNIFWQVAGSVSIGSTSHFEGIILGKTSVALQTSATLNGRILSQTAVTLDNNVIVQK